MLSKLSVELAVTLTRSLAFSINTGFHLYLPVHPRPEFENCNIAVLTDCGWALSIALGSCYSSLFYGILELGNQ